MFDYHISFNSPWFLLLLLLLPLVWMMSFKGLSALGRVRRWVVLGLRTVVMLLLILTLAEVQWVRTSDRLTVVYLLDQSLSIPAEHKRAMIEYVNASILEHREKKDRAGVIVFGRDAAIEIPPFDDSVQIPPAIESMLDPEHTNLSGAMRLAQASFPEDAAKRIVIVSDGNENLGDALKQARAVSGSGIGIDVVPVHYESRSEVSVQRLSIPSDVRRGQPFNMKVVVNNSSKPRPGETGVIRGRLVLSQLVNDRTQVLSDVPVSLTPGKKVFIIPQRIDSPAFYKYQVRFVPDNPGDDGMPQNNRATTFTHVRGKGQVLLIEDHEQPGQFDFLAERLRKQNLEVTVQPTNRLFSDMAALQSYDTVILGDVGRERFTESQIEMLVRNTQQMGSGLVMLGGPNSFGAGGWTNSKLEDAMPVEFQIKSAKVIPRGALAMLMHASEMARGNYWQKVIGREALKMLGPRDYCGVIHWSGRDQWLWRGGLIEVGQKRKKMIAYIDRMTPGDMPQFDPAMVMAAKGFAKLPDAAIKHMIIISDGDPSPPSRRVINQLKALNVTVTTVAVGTHGPAGHATLQRLARQTGGKYHVVKNPKALPRIFQREARRVARPLIYESKTGFQPQIQMPHEMVRGLDDQLPAITGFVMTTVKDNPLVEVALVSPKPSGGRNSTILASWNYGLGKAVAFTSDAGSRWTANWTGWEGYDKLFGQIVRWSMRPTEQRGNFNVSTRVEDGKAKIVVTALDKDDEFLNFLSVSGDVIGPNLKPKDLKLRQTAPGRYVGEFPAADAGSYFLMINTGQKGQAFISTGFNVAYSSEFRDQVTNDALLGEIAALQPKDGAAGEVIEASADGNGAPLEQLLAINTFRHDLSKATSSQDAWHLVLLLAACIFFADVFTRRVQVSFAWVPPLAVSLRDRILGRPAEDAQPEYMERLQSRKAEVVGRFEQIRSDTRFELPTESEPGDTTADINSIEELSDPSANKPRQAKPAKPSIVADKQAEEESYTERLLRAKKKVWEGRDEKKE